MMGLVAIVAATPLGLTRHGNAQTELAIIGASDAAAGEFFGSSVAIDGSWALIGARREGPPTQAGAAYFVDLNSFVQTKRLAFDRLSGDNFGAAVGISGNIAVVGAPGDDRPALSPSPALTDSGSAYVFRFDAMTMSWVFAQKLQASDAQTNDNFGMSVAVDGDVIVVGNDNSNNAHDGAYVFRFNPGTQLWNEEETLVPSGISGGFGQAVDIDGDDVVVGARFTSTNAGAAYVFHYDGSAWSEQAQLIASDAVVSDFFGTDVAISGNDVIVGSPHDDDFGSSSGSVYVYVRSGSTWSQTQKLNGTGTDGDDAFGQAVDVDGNRLVVTAFTFGSNEGRAFFFNKGGSSWNEVDYLSPSVNIQSDQFGNAVAVSGTTALIGAQGFEANPLIVTDNRGGAFLFELGSDSDGDGVPDATDNCPSIANTDQADLDNDGQGNVCDPDDDNDGVLDTADNCPSTANTNQADFDNDGAGNACDLDDDNDGLSDVVEGTFFSNPLDVDSDNDTLDDGVEFGLGTNPNSADSDNDGLSDAVEASAAGCPDPTVADSDGDGLNDGLEHNAGWDPCDADTDGDTLSDADEIAHGTDPLIGDSDADGASDGLEVTLAAGGLCPDPLDPDSDIDGILDGDEVTGGSGPCDADSDNDGLNDGNEIARGTNMFDSDSDDDGLFDGTEVDIAMGGTCPSPTDADSDNDTLSDGVENGQGSSPCMVDTDGDTLHDNQDPTPTIPGIPPTNLSNLVRGTAAAVDAYPLIEYLGPNDNARSARMKVMANQITLAAVAIDSGNYTAAKAFLTTALARVDGDNSPPDWMNGPHKSVVYGELQTWWLLVNFLN